MNRLEISEVTSLIIGDLSGGAIVTAKGAGETVVELHLTTLALAQLESLLAKGAVAQAEAQPKQ